jgi:hypothetical protein
LFFGKRALQLTSQDAIDPRLGADQGAAVEDDPEDGGKEELT